MVQGYLKEQLGQNQHCPMPSYHTHDLGLNIYLLNVK